VGHHAGIQGGQCGIRRHELLSTAPACTQQPSLEVLYDAGKRASIVLELLGAIFDLDAHLFADEFVMRAFVCVLKAAPSADVLDRNVIEVGTIGLNVVQQLK
jgi:hypothetical protein